MIEIALKNADEMTIKAKDRIININVAQSTIDAGLDVGLINGAGEFEIGEAIITATAISDGVMYRLEAEGIAIGIARGAKPEELDELGPIDILGTTDSKIVGIVEPKIVIPMGNMDFSEVKASVKMEKRLKIKSAATLPATLEVYKLD